MYNQHVFFQYFITDATKNRTGLFFYKLDWYFLKPCGDMEKFSLCSFALCLQKKQQKTPIHALQSTGIPALCKSILLNLIAVIV
jgi:hypothetical protein